MHCPKLMLSFDASDISAIIEYCSILPLILKKELRGEGAKILDVTEFLQAILRIQKHAF